jgi:aldehyde dehydrogenase (NAD+)
LSGHVRARHLYSLARHIQKHSRLIAVIEALDNGKSIRETRDSDVLIVVRHLYYYAGWAELMDEQVCKTVSLDFGNTVRHLNIY